MYVYIYIYGERDIQIITVTVQIVNRYMHKALLATQ